MNREIKFRGYGYGGQWHFGNLIRRVVESPVQESTQEYETFYIQEQNLSGKEIEVFPDTIGQCTGLKDKNGKKIFEGDIVTIGNNLKAVIIWFNGSFRFQDELSCKATYLDDMGVIMRDYDVAVIGNIHNNPELLKGGE